MPTWAINDTLAADASETLLKVDFRAPNFSTMTQRSLPVHGETLANGTFVPASARGETADLTLSPSETDLFRHSRRYSNPIVFLPQMRPSDISSGNGSITPVPPTSDGGLVDMKPVTSFRSSSGESDDTDTAYLSAEEGSVGEGYLTPDEDRVANRQPMVRPPSKPDALQDYCDLLPPKRAPTSAELKEPMESPESFMILQQVSPTDNVIPRAQDPCDAIPQEGLEPDLVASLESLNDRQKQKHQVSVSAKP